MLCLLLSIMYLNISINLCSRVNDTAYLCTQAHYVYMYMLCCVYVYALFVVEYYVFEVPILN